MTAINNLQTLFQPKASSTETSGATTAAVTRGASTDTPSHIGQVADGDAGNVDVSNTATALLSTDSDVRQDKVASLKAAIASGTYNVSSTAVADKLIEHMLGH